MFRLNDQNEIVSELTTFAVEFPFRAVSLEDLGFAIAIFFDYTAKVLTGGFAGNHGHVDGADRSERDFYRWVNGGRLVGSSAVIVSGRLFYRFRVDWRLAQQKPNPISDLDFLRFAFCGGRTSELDVCATHIDCHEPEQRFWYLRVTSGSGSYQCARYTSSPPT